MNLDSGQVEIGSPPPEIPKKETAELIAKLKRLLVPKLINLDTAFPGGFQSFNESTSRTAPQQQEEKMNEDLQIRIAFMEYFISLFANYRRYITFLRQHPKPIAIFNKASFLKERPDAVVCF